MKTAILALVALLAAAGCKTHEKPVAPASQTVLSPMADSAAALKKAADNAATKQADKDSKAAASVEVIARNNEAAPASPQKPVIAAEVGLLQRILGTAPTPEDRAAAAEREQLVLKGRLDEANQKYADASQRADSLNAQIAAANAQRALALSQLDAAIAKAKTDLAEQRAKHEAGMKALAAAHAAELAKERDRANGIALAKQVRDLNIAGAACLLLFAIGVGFGGVAALTKVWPLGFIGLLCFGLAQLVSQWWFMWAALGCVVAALGVAGWWVWRHIKEGDLKAAADAKAAKFSAALGDIVPALDKAYDEADHATRDLLDKTVFARLSDVMDKATKQTIHEVRADSGAPA